MSFGPYKPLFNLNKFSYFVIFKYKNRMMHKSLSGKRCSDHVAFLIAFQQWLKARWHGEEAEMEFCERKSLNMQTMRMVITKENYDLS